MTGVLLTQSASEADSGPFATVYLNLNKMDTQLSKKKDLIGAYLLSVRWGRDKPDGYKDNFDVFREHRGHACVDIHTDKGKVQLVAYNEHNGWYPHSVVASWGFGDKAYMDKQDI